MAKKTSARMPAQYLTDPAPPMNFQALEDFAFAAPPPPEPKRTWGGTLADVGISALKGAIGVPEAAVGLADAVTGGQVGKFLENEGGMIGFRPKQARMMLEDQYSEPQKQAFRKVQDAHGIVDTAAAALQNPSVLAHSIIESLPSIGAGGVVGRGAAALAPRMGAAGAGAIGEGVVSAGQTAEQIRQDSPDGTMSLGQGAIALGSGALTGALSLLGGRVAQALGIHDVDTMVATAAKSPEVSKGVVRRVLEGAASEGLLEELPQSVQEQVAQNWATGKPLDEGVDQAAVLGTLTGGAMGAGANVLPGHGHAPQPMGMPPVGTLTPTPAGPAPAAPVAPPAGPMGRAVQTGQAVGAIAPAAPTAAAPGARMAPAAPVSPPPNTDPATGEILAPTEIPTTEGPDGTQRGTFATEQEARDYISAARRKPRNAAIQAEPVQQEDGRWALALPGEPGHSKQEAKTPAPVAQREDTDILTASGKPFATMGAARTKAAQLGPDHQPVAVEGGFVVRKNGSASNANSAPQAGPADAAGVAGSAGGGEGGDAAPKEEAARKLTRDSRAKKMHVDISYDPTTGQFRDPDGAPIDRAGLAKLAQAGHGRGALAGGSTLARGSVLRALLREEGGQVGSGARDGSGLLGAVVRQSAVHPQALKDHFYSLNGEGQETPAAATKQAEGMSADAVRAEVARIAQHWTGAPEVITVQSMQDQAVPEAIRSEDARQRSQGATGNPEGFYFGGKVYLVAPELRTVAGQCLPTFSTRSLGTMTPS